MKCMKKVKAATQRFVGDIFDTYHPAGPVITKVNDGVCRQHRIRSTRFYYVFANSGHGSSDHFCNLVETAPEDPVIPWEKQRKDS